MKMEKTKHKNGSATEHILDAVDSEIERRYYGEVRPSIFKPEPFPSYLMWAIKDRREKREPKDKRRQR